MRKYFFTRNSNSIVPSLYYIEFDVTKFLKEGTHASNVGYYLRNICLAYDPICISRFVKELLEFLSDNEYDSDISIRIGKAPLKFEIACFSLFDCTMGKHGNTALYDKGVFQGFTDYNKGYLQQYMDHMPETHIVAKLSSHVFKKITKGFKK